MTNLNFSCTKCGSCCKSAPQLTTQETMDLSEHFFIQLSHYSILSYEKTPLSKELIEHYSRFCQIFFLPEKQCHLFYFVSLSSVNRPSAYCSKLSNNLCSIENDKPLFCKAAPLNIMMPEEKQIEIFNTQWAPLINNNTFKCDTSLSAQKLIVNNAIAQEQYQNDYYTLLNSIRQLTNFYVTHVLSDEKKRKEHIGYCFESCSQTNSSLFYTSCLDLFDFYYKLSLINQYQLDSFINKQKIFLKKEIAKALIQKDLNDRSITKLMRKELEKLENYIYEEENDEVKFH